MHSTEAAGESALRIDVVYVDEVYALLALSGRLDAVEAPRARQIFDSAQVAAAARLTIDLTDVTFVDSAGLAVLARARRDRGLTGGSVTLIRPRSDDAMRVFRLTQFDQIFVMRDSADEVDDR
ncbi:STAS domain-containing protein [Microbacterium proteolyticum]|uniref:STAS domain-containing protein n=1 Tax=Microbacterium proteolyticum TaxID=1572644 RepID=UPI002415B36C|nr:STAS domain-containing protein [Microbacterium proteolyticum]